jgi:hypothetical protein
MVLSCGPKQKGNSASSNLPIGFYSKLRDVLDSKHTQPPVAVLVLNPHAEVVHHYWSSKRAGCSFQDRPLDAFSPIWCFTCVCPDSVTEPISSRHGYVCLGSSKALLLEHTAARSHDTQNYTRTQRDNLSHLVFDEHSIGNTRMMNAYLCCDSSCTRT